MAEPTDKSLTPEKRLLELIEEPEALKKEVGEGKKQSALANLFSPASIKQFLALLVKKTSDWAAEHKAFFEIRSLNRILKIIIAVLFLIFIIDGVISMVDLEQDFASSIKIPDSKIFDLPEVKTPGEETSSVENWNLEKMFMPYGKRQEEAEKIRKEQSSKLVEMSKNLKLTGISYNPKEPEKALCMIEDIEKNITTFLGEGDPIGILRVKEIEVDRVLLESGDETVELH